MENQHGPAELGRIYLARNQFHRAASHLRKALLLTPSDSGLRPLLASALLQSRRYAEGIALFREHLDTAPDDLESALSLANALAEERKAEEALPLLQSLESRFPDETNRIRIRKAALFLQMDSPEKALEILSRIDKEAQAGLEALELQAECAWRLNRPLQAEAHWLSALKLNPGPETFVKLGRFYLTNGKPAAAVRILTKAVQLRPWSAQTLPLYGHALFAAGPSPDIRKTLHRLTFLGPDQPAALLTASLLYEKLGETGKSAERLGRYLESGGRACDAFLLLLRILTVNPNAFQEESSAAWVKTAYARFRQNPLFCLAYAEHLAASGHGETAVTLLQKALDAPDTAQRARLCMAAVYHKSRDIAKTLFWLDKVLETDPGNAAALLRSGALYLEEHRDLACAGERLKRLLACEPENPRGLYLMSKLQFASQNSSDAEQTLRLALCSGFFDFSSETDDAFIRFVLSFCNRSLTGISLAL